MADGDRLFGAVSQELPSYLSTGNRPVRLTTRGEAVVNMTGKGAYAYADEGSYFIAQNPTVGTAISGIVAADGAEGLENLFYIENTSATKRIYLDYLRLIPTAAGASGTTTRFVSAIHSAARYTSGGTAITPQNASPSSGEGTVATVYFGALVTTAPAGITVMDHGALRLGVIKVVGDIYLFDFGGDKLDMPSVVTSGTAQAFVPWRHPPVVLGQGECFTLEVYGASQNGAADFEFQARWWER